MAKKTSFIAELQDKTIKELVQMRRTFKQELYAYKMKNAIKGFKETHKIGDTKIKIARINTVLTHKIKEQHGGNMK
ncbi:MAG: 50S ribosomal protein L29 [Candidatus Absconditabacterales bacterium]|jgi:ribosomal protein L29